MGASVVLASFLQRSKGTLSARSVFPRLVVWCGGIQTHAGQLAEQGRGAKI